jgi:uncharacterized protein YndB with AHSA1/START domain
MSKDAIMIERTFDAPVEVIWQLWTQPEYFKNWYAPEGFTVPVVESDVRVGGKRLFCMEGQTPDGHMKMWLTGEYTEIVPNQRLVYTESMADEHGNILPLGDGIIDDEHPTTTIITVLLEDLSGRTKMVMTHAGMPASEQGAREGWEQAFNKMAAYIQTNFS